ncbi:SDR family NAD(P)-dependent oxidoreductase [Pseudobutyrivibrio xylanivorans]|uniref:SDR family oxidoreductase n=1 Tax=Pseudobutyrivibrio xylanivorans TaxID=185007 RepID=A0A5P6VNP2_PSEXY|nr:SDR family oxidoreductase [Pseudobutyrivibrio xylanivorans]QFJ54296.1 SDR family oxidoreductase [Pseudobutyrivibrio xylanivorans]
MKILITGASRGIGLACAKKYVEMGHDVIGFDITESEFKSPSYTHMLVDITGTLPDIDDVEVLINNVGIQEGPNVISTNLTATISVTEKYAFQDKIHSVLFMASSSASNGAEFPEYAASKGGVVTYMKNSALRLAKFKATSNSISAGGVYTPLNFHITENPTLMEQCLNETLLHRWASAEEIAELSYFLTNVNLSMTGQDLLIDNGEQLKSNFIW